MKEIVQRGNPVLRDVAGYVAPEEISSDALQNIISEMQASLKTQKDGVALAAPQIGISKQIFVIAPFIFKHPEMEHLVYINPEIIATSKKTKLMHEGCLSCRWTVGEVERHLEATVRAYDEHGNQFTEKADGLLAHIFQHETDHLHGILFIDKGENLREMSDAEIKEITG